MAPVIRQATTTDAKVLAAIIRDSFRDVAERFGLTRQNCISHPSFTVAEDVSSGMEAGVTYYLLEVDGKPCGCTALDHGEENACWLQRLAVLPAYRKNGYGGLLVEHAFGEAKKMAVKLVEIGIIANHEELRAWYEKLGFVARETVEIGHLPFKVTFMIAKLDQPAENAT